MYGQELILDVCNCNVSKFNRKDMKKYLVILCDDIIDMEREDLHWWDYENDQEAYEAAPEHLKGTSVCQFIKTSNIIMHTLDDIGNLHLNVFSCKDFDENKVIDFTLDWFEGEVLSKTIVPRLKTPKVEILQMKGHNFLWINDYLWMWDVEAEEKAQKDIAAQAYGDVLCAGYGLGLVQRYLEQNEKVKSITTVEKLKQVIDINLKHFGKIHGRVIIEDFFDYMKPNGFDCIVGDVCDDILPSYLPDYREFKAKAMSFLKSDGKLLQWGGDFFEFLLSKDEEQKMGEM